ncbi:MAG: AAA family ATPase [Elusimicrobia bacterium]|nr:AAA family ATPase [Elusimicrobiota bacterium]MBK7207093.1 AAA family ATPase [Elusimicrobiota bacterium]MBK7545899.1 AAA family ATPase [Elusimicrobiota bacterium]MBK7574775.1 AAA family ATPase [Elusimicrobiota bacterium]MBK7687573.1 AAA family ATPase [Elusimicrobiota bacterium]
MLTRIKLWFAERWFKWMIFALVAFAFLLFLISIFAFFAIDSYTRLVMLAQNMLMIPLTFLSALVFVFFYTKGFGRMFGNNKGTVRGDKVNIRFKDVVGLDNAKKEALEVVSLLRDRAKLKAIGGQVVKGLLFFGPPGTGKTLLAKAIATEAGIPFISMSGSEFVEVFVGVGASRVRNLFKTARLQAQAHGGCLIFIDEIDAIGRSRKLSWFGSQETDTTLNQLLTDMDGLNESVGNVVVIGATNAPEDSLDPALLRAGRFDRHVHIDRPNLHERVEVFRYYLRKVKHDPNLDLARLARRAVGRSPADIMNICKEAALIAMREKSLVVEYNHLSKAVERIDLGVVRHLTMTLPEKEATAFHEAGHLVTLYQLHPTEDVFKATIIPRGGALGVVWHNPREERHSHDRNKLIADIKVSLAGFVAEKIKYGVTTTGVAQDFSNATFLASRMVWSLGMGSGGFIGDFTVMQRSGTTHSDLSESLKTELNKEVNQILSQCAKEVEEFLRAEWALVERFAKELCDKHELEYDEIHAIFSDCGKGRRVVPLETVTVGEDPTPNNALPPATPPAIAPGDPAPRA